MPLKTKAPPSEGDKDILIFYTASPQVTKRLEQIFPVLFSLRLRRDFGQDLRWRRGWKEGRKGGHEGWWREILPHRDAVGASDKQIPNSSSLNRPCSVYSHNGVMGCVGEEDVHRSQLYILLCALII